jgi:toxin-antitoxin system PIN domain toxin
LIWLFDVNVLIAIADSGHVFHNAIHRWLAASGEGTWASCPLTENGMVRVLSQPAYRGGARTPAAAISALRGLKEARPWKHVFWADDFSLCDEREIRAERIAGTKQLTDVYLAALARRRGGRLVTFDTGISWHAVAGGSADLIEIPSV